MIKKVSSRELQGFQSSVTFLGMIFREARINLCESLRFRGIARGGGWDKQPPAWLKILYSARVLVIFEICPVPHSKSPLLKILATPLLGLVGRKI